MLRRLLESTLAVCLAFLLTAEAAAQEPNSSQVTTPLAATKSSITLPKDTQVAMILLETISSATATKGQRVRLTVANDVVVKGLTVIPKGTSGTGVISRLRKGTPGKRDGYLEVKPVALTLADGTRVKLKEYPTGQDSCGDMGPCWALLLFVVAISPFVIAALPIEAVVALLRPDRAKGKTTYQNAKPEGEDMTLALCSGPGMESFVARPATLRSIDPIGLTATTSLDQCPNLAFPK